MLNTPTSAEAFRQAARGLLAEGVPPEGVTWRFANAQQAGLFEAGEPIAPRYTEQARPGTPPARVPRWYPELAQRVILHGAPGRFDLLYRLLWRLQAEPGLRHDTLDPDRILAERMARAVAREIHKMHAFVRFRPVRDHPGQPDDDCLHLAWFDPEHAVLEAATPFFVRRFTRLRWSILTPTRSAHWNGERLSFDAGAPRPPVSGSDGASASDDGEALWLAYYRSIFNPARLKTAAMLREMPRRYWAALPESVEISGLIRQASERTGRMIDIEPGGPTARFASDNEFP